MAKTVTSKKRSVSAKKSLRVHVPFKNPELKNAKLVADILIDCLRENDIESFREVLIAHLMTANKVAIAKKSGIGRRTLYDLMDTTKPFNPELSTVSALLHAFAA